MLNRKSLTTLLGVSLSGFAVLFSGASIAQADDRVEEVQVWGRSLQLLGTADSASKGVVGYSDFSTRPMSRVAELVELIPGMIATQHSGPGKANQYFMRGFTSITAQISLLILTVCQSTGVLTAMLRDIWI